MFGAKKIIDAVREMFREHRNLNTDLYFQREIRRDKKNADLMHKFKTQVEDAVHDVVTQVMDARLGKTIAPKNPSEGGITCVLEDRNGFTKTVQFSEPIPYINVPVYMDPVVTAPGTTIRWGQNNNLLKCRDCGTVHRANEGNSSFRSRVFRRVMEIGHKTYLYREEGVS